MQGESGSQSGWLDGYKARDETERAHLERLAELLASDEDPFDRTTPLHLTGSALVVHRPTRRVLLRWHARQHDWLQVGGHADPGEDDPFAVALREAEEETGLFDLTPWPAARAAAILHIALVDVAASEDEAPHQHADVRYLLTTESPEAVRPESLAAPLRWSPLDVAIELARPNLAETMRRVSYSLFP